jgi:TPP-dependent pyruvate/acetoin dehydrogenase alpha subunit
MAEAAGVGAMREPSFLLQLYRRMVTIRRTEETLVRLFAESVTYRLHGHYEGDPGRYRKAEQVSRWRERGPIPRFAAHLSGLGLLTERCRGDRAAS